MLRQRRATLVYQEVRSELAPRMGRPAQCDRIQMHALEMLRGLVLFGVTDGAECMLGLQRNASQRVAGEGNRRSRRNNASCGRFYRAGRPHDPE